MFFQYADLHCEYDQCTLATVKFRHKGTCYKAANWVNVGRTTGRGKKSISHERLIPAKDIWLYPLRKNFATLLCK